MMNSRTKRAKQMIESGIFSSQFDDGKYRVQSQSDPDKFYVVSETVAGLVCECPDHQKRKADCKHIKVILRNIRQNHVYANTPFRILERSSLRLCKFCHSGRIVKAGIKRNKKSTLQRYKCQDCSRRFTTNFGFENRQHDVEVITGAMQMYYSGMSSRAIEHHYEMLGVQVDHSTIHDWVDRYSGLTSRYVDGIIPRVGNWFRADEVWIKIAGQLHYLFASMEDDTRYWLTSDLADNKFQHSADRLLIRTKQQAGKAPTHFITDCLAAYAKSCKKIFGKNTYHKADAGIRSKRKNRLGQETGHNYHPSNNKMERLNGEIRDREKVFRGLKTPHTNILDGMRVHHNYTRKHSALDGRTPAQAALIEVEGINKWKTLIQNAALSEDHE